VVRKSFVGTWGQAEDSERGGWAWAPLRKSKALTQSAQRKPEDKEKTDMGAGVAHGSGSAALRQEHTYENEGGALQEHAGGAFAEEGDGQEDYDHRLEVADGADA
jgi:hypothetical protein